MIDWISTKQSRPVDGMRVLVTYQNDIGQRSTGIGYRCLRIWMVDGNARKVFAWTPLPKPCDD